MKFINKKHFKIKIRKNESPKFGDFYNYFSCTRTVFIGLFEPRTFELFGIETHEKWIEIFEILKKTVSVWMLLFVSDSFL